jgi:hypothetical protein
MNAARAELADAQARLVAALVAGAPVPAGFDAERTGQAARALLRKRAGEVARAWPRLAGAFAADWPGIFVRWAEGRPPRGGWRDGFDFARENRETLPALAAVELAINEVRWVYDGRRLPRRRWLPAVTRFPGGVALGLFGRVALWSIPEGRSHQ